MLTEKSLLLEIHIYTLDYLQMRLHDIWDLKIIQLGGDWGRVEMISHN